ncbi:MAG: glutamine amidotransferase, partial [Alphaproteobacteria bacterium]|nr:glutamine amidotransferase [Alphaproteobacteria bacterium]
MTKILMIVHSRTSDTGRVGRVLAEWSYELDVRCPLHGCELPADMDAHAGAVVFGGPQSVHDRDAMPAIKAEIDWIPRACDSGKPFLGICLGAQMLALSQGAKVDFHPVALHEIGYAPVRPLPAWRDMMAETTY